MSIKHTSLIALRKAEKDGTLKKLRDRVILAFCNAQPDLFTPLGHNRVCRTRREAAKVLKAEASSVSGAVNRLIEEGALITMGKTRCSVTNNEVEYVASVINYNA